MLGSIIGDIIGSIYEFHNVKRTDFNLFSKDSRFTDDSTMTIAVAKWLVEDSEHSKHTLVETMQKLGRSHPDRGYGGNFRRWLFSRNPLPYNSWGNGSAMRVSPVGLYAKKLSEALELAKISAEVTHNHPEGIKGAQAIAASVFLAKEGLTKSFIKKYITRKFGYNLDRSINDIRKGYTFDVSCQGSVPEAIIAFLEGNSFEEVIRLAVSIGGDSDTIACMAGAIARLGAEREDMPWHDKELNPEFRQWVIDFHTQKAPVIRLWLESYKTKVEVVFFHTREEVDLYINTFKLE